MQRRTFLFDFLSFCHDLEYSNVYSLAFYNLLQLHHDDDDVFGCGLKVTK